MKDRILYFDAVKLLAIFLVLYGHCEQHLLFGHPYESPIYIYIYSFHMSLFMLISGFFSHSVMKLDFLQALKKKARQLLLPCLSWGAVIIAIRILLGNVIDIETIIIKDIWFLKSLFFCIMLVYIYKHLPQHVNYIFFILTLLLVQHPVVNVMRINDMYPAFVFGYFLHSKMECIHKYKSLIIILALFVYGILGSYYINPSFFANEAGIVNFAIKRISVLLIELSASLSIVLAFIMIESKLLPTICKYGKYTLEIYLVQTLILENLASKFICLDECNTVVTHLLLFPLIICIIIFISVGISKLSSKKKMTNLLLFGK